MQIELRKPADLSAQWFGAHRIGTGQKLEQHTTSSGRIQMQLAEIKTKNLPRRIYFVLSFRLN